MPEDKRTYSSVYAGQKPGEGHARSTLNSEQAWSAGTAALEVDDEWMQLDLGDSKMVGGVAIQPRSPTEYVTTYTVSYSMTGEDGDWRDIPGIFKGNEADEATSIKKNIFATPIKARYVKINPKTAVTWMSMRADVLLAVQMANTPEEQRSYSSVYNADHARSTINSELCWAPATQSDTEWMQLHFGEHPKLVVGTVMQARADDNGQITTSYRVSYSLTGEDMDWHDIPGTYSAGRYGLFEATFPTAVLARHVMLHPVTWEGYPAMRVDAIISPDIMVIEDTPELQRDYSSVLDGHQKGTGHARSSLSSPVGWIPATPTPGEWMQLNLGAKAKKVTGTVVAGRNRLGQDFEQFVTAYTVSYSLTGEDDDWHEITGTWPCDRYKEFANFFPSAVLARFVRLTIQSWDGAGGPCMRASAITIPGTMRMAQTVTELLH